MDTAARARQLALLGVETRANQSQSTGSNAGSGGQTAHEPAGSSKGGQFTSSPHGGSGLGSMPTPAPKSGSSGKKPAGSVPAGTPQAPASPRTMQSGDSGEDVRYAQYAMSLLGFKVDQSGNYDQATADAVKQIQQRLGAKKPNGHLSASDLRKLQDAVRLSPCIGGGQRDLAFEAQWEQRKFNPDQPRDFHGRWSLTAAVIDALKAAGGKQGGAHFDNGAYFDWSIYDPKTREYSLEIGDGENAVTYQMDDYSLGQLHSALAVTRLRDSAEQHSPAVAALVAGGHTDHLVLDDGTFDIDWSVRAPNGDYQFAVSNTDEDQAAEFDLTPAEMDKLVASLALSTQTADAVAGPNPTAQRSADLDEDTEVLIEALGEFIGADERSFTEALHPRNPKGSAGGGRFRSIVDRVVDALSEWKKGNGPDDPLKDFNREQLLKAGKAHGHTFRRGAPIEEIKAQILDDVRNGAKAEKAAAPHLPGAPADHRRFTIQLGGKVDPAAAREVEVENKVRQAWNDAQKAPGGWVGLARLRDSETLREVPREEVDAALKRLAREPGVRVAPNENTKSLHREDIDAAVQVGDSPRHMIAFERGHAPSASGKTALRPLPALGGTATDVGIFGNPTTGKLSLYRESDTGKRTGRAIKSFDDMGSLESWARDNGHTELADYAKAEQARTGGAAKVAKAAPAKAAKKAAAPAGPHIEVAGSTKELTPTQLARGEHLTAAGRQALDSLGPAGHPRIAAIPDTEGKVREAYRMLAIPGSGQDHHVAIADVRKLIGDQVPRSELDADLKRLALTPGNGIRLEPQSYARENAATRIPAAVMYGGQEHNLLHVDDPTLAQPSQFGALAMADELDARRLDGERDPMMANLSDAELAAEIKARAAKDPVVARDLANRKPANPLAGLEGLTTVQKRAALRKRGLSKAEIDAVAPLERKPRKAARALELLGVTRALGHDVTPGHDELHHYWTVGEGRIKWVESPKPWTTLVAHLTKYVGPLKAKTYASRWFHEVFGFYAGSDLNRVTHGQPPRGHRIGPG